MPLSSERKKNPIPLAGIPRPVIRRAPHGWPPARKAEWCRSFLVGAAGIMEPPKGRPAFATAAFMAGRTLWTRGGGGSRDRRTLDAVSAFMGNARLGRLA